MKRHPGLNRDHAVVAFADFETLFCNIFFGKIFLDVEAQTL